MRGVIGEPGRTRAAVVLSGRDVFWLLWVAVNMRKRLRCPLSVTMSVKGLGAEPCVEPTVGD